MGTTTFINSSKIERNWFVVDATDIPLGRLASTVAQVLIGKKKPQFTTNADAGDFVVVINAEKIGLTGNKKNGKEYHRHSRYPGGLRTRSAQELLDLKPEMLVEKAVKGMLPKRALGRQMFTKLKVYVGTEHPHQAQNPKPLSISNKITTAGTSK